MLRFILDERLLARCDTFRRNELLSVLQSINSGSSSCSDGAAAIDERESVVRLVVRSPRGVTFELFEDADQPPVAERMVFWSSLKTHFKDYQRVIEGIVAMGTSWCGGFEELDYGKKAIHNAAGTALFRSSLRSSLWWICRLPAISLPCSF